MIASLAAISGGLTLLAVLVLGAAARRPRPARRAGPERTPMPSRRSLPSRRMTVAVLAVSTGTVTVVVAGPAAAALAVVVTASVLMRRGRAAATRRQRAVEAALPDATELLVLCIHAGRSPTQAVAEVAARAPPAVASVFASVEHGLHRGRSLADALDDLPRLVGPAGRELAVAIATAEREGQPLGPVLDHLASDARAARRRLGEAEARRLPVRMTFPLVLCTLPSFVLLAIAPAVLGALSTLRAGGP